MKAEINYEKRTQLQQRIKQRLQQITEKDCIVAFSGGVDSALLLKMTCEAAEEKGRKVYAVTMQTKLHPINEIAHAKAVAEEIGAEHLVLAVDELAEAGLTKREVRELAKMYGLSVSDRPAPPLSGNQISI